MPISHRFIKELKKLEDNPLKGEFNCLVIGTFNPQDGSNVKKNDANWFYGRNRNKFWHLFPAATINTSLHPSHNKDITHLNKLGKWKLFAERNRIVFIDMIKEVRANELTSFQDAEIFKYETDSFDIEKAFSGCNFKYVVYTRSTWDNSQINQLKVKYDSFFKSKGAKIIDLFTPAGYYGKGNTLETKLGWYKRDLAGLKSLCKKYPNYE